MNTTVTLHLPEELCGKLEQEAKKHHLSVNQYILYTLTKTLSYNEALKLVHKKLSQIAHIPIVDVLNAIPDRQPLPGDEL
jgi:hypothetical protein